MKRILLTTALVAFTAGSAMAQDESQLRTAVATEFTTMGLDIDASTLTNAQLSEIYLLTNSTDMGKRQKIEAALSGMGLMADEDVAMEVSNSQLRNSVRNSFNAMGIEGDADTLSDAEVAEIYLMVNSAEMGDATESQIQEALAGMAGGSTDSAEERMIMVTMPQSQLRLSVANKLQAMGIEADVNALSQTQLAQIKLLVGDSTDNNVKAQVEAIVN